MQFPDFFDVPLGIIRKLDETINMLAPQLFDMLLDFVQVNAIKTSMTENGLKTEDALNGCDALGHMATMHEALELPITLMSINVFGCGCLFGLMGGDEFIGYLCNEHISRLSGTPITEITDDMRRPAVNTLIQKWLENTAPHIREHHKNYAETFRKIDGSRYDFNAVFQADPEQKRHDDIARELLDE